MTRRRKGLASACIAGALVAAVAVARGPERGAEHDGSLGAANYPRWPAESIADWVGFADQVSVLTIVSERQLPMQPEVKEIGEGYVGREVTAEIESTIWRRAKAASTAGPVTVRVWGWTVHEHRLRPFGEAGAPRLEVGDRVLAALLKAPEGSWAVLSAGATIPLDVSGPAPSEAQLRTVPLLRGKSVLQIGSLLAVTRPSAAAAEYQHLDVDARATAVWNEMLGVTE